MWNGALLAIPPGKEADGPGVDGLAGLVSGVGAACR